MATSTVTPPAAAAPSTPAAAAAPSTPVSTPTPAPNTIDTPVGSQNNLEAKIGAAWETIKSEVPEPSDAPAPAEPAASETTEEPAAASTEPEAAAEPDKKPEAVAEPETKTDEFKFALDDDGEAASPEALFKELKADPAAQKFFEDRPELKNKVMAALRRDTENRELRKIVPDVETAQEMARGATLFSDFDTKFLGATTPEGYKSFIDKWVEEAVMLDDKGQPLMENGQYKLHPSLPYIMNQIYENQSVYALDQFSKTGTLTPQQTKLVSAVADHFLQKAKVSGDERLEAAAEIFKGAVAPQPSASEELPEHLRSLQDSLTAKEKALKEQEESAARQRQESESKAQREANEQSIERTWNTAAYAIETQLKPRLAAAGLSDYEQGASLRNISEAIDLSIGMNPDGSWKQGTSPGADWFQSRFESILRTQKPGDARERALRKLILTHVNELLPTMLTAEIRNATKGRVDRQTSRQATVEGQKKVSATDPKGTSITPSAPNQGQVTKAQLEKEYMDSHNGEKPSLEWVMGEAMSRISGARK